MDIVNSSNIYSIDLQHYTVDTLRELLRSNILEITFTKADGTQRIMQATLKTDTIVPYERKTNREKIRSEHIISVWDVEASSWRSINFDKIERIVCHYEEGEVLAHAN